MRKNNQNKNTYTTIGRICYCNLLLSCFLLSGCNLFFKPNEQSISKIETYDQLVNAADGVYGQLTNVLNNLNFLLLNSNADDLFIGGSNYYRIYYQGKNSDCLVGENPKLDESFVYISLFGVIASINNILSQYDIENIDDPSIRNILGELFFLRAYCYFRLTRSYGQIPLISDTDVNYTIKKPSFEEIYEFIEYDLFKAIQLLPGNNTNCRVPFQTPHRGSVKALLAEVYLSWAGFPVKDLTKYQMAKTVAAEVIDSAGFYGFSLLPDFADLWNKTGRYNQESIYSVYVKNSAIYEGSCFSCPDDGTVVGYDFATDNKILFLGLDPAAEVNFYNSFPRDYRRDITFFNSIYVPPPGEFEVLPSDVDTGYNYIDQVDPCSRISYRKFYLDSTLTLNQYVIDSIHEKKYKFYNLHGCPRICLFRYAQTLLTYAEAAARSGSLDDNAYQYLNMVRRRANNVDLYTSSRFDLQPGLSSDNFADSVVTERGWELAGEPEGRWFDLLRLGRIDIVLKSNSANEDNYLYTSNQLVNYFIPIPESDLILNPNLK